MNKLHFINLFLIITLCGINGYTVYNEDVLFAIKESKNPSCDMIIAESMPQNLTFDSSYVPLTPISTVWMEIIKNYQKNLHITSFYWTMLNEDIATRKYPSSLTGEKVFRLLLEKSKNYSLEVVVNYPVKSNIDIVKLLKNKKVKVYMSDFESLISRGVQHAKVWIADNKTAFIGSPNMDWRALTQIKELGIYLPDCQPIAEDLDKFWATLKYVSGINKTIPQSFPSYLSPKYNLENPLIASVNGILSSIYTATSPKQLNPINRTNDLDAILYTINNAKKFISISVMDFGPITVGYGKFNNTYWPIIQDALIKAAFDRKVKVKLLISKWKYSSPDMFKFLESLQLLIRASISIEVKLFVIPAFNEEQRKIPYSRVSHSKYMVTEDTAYVGTSNWMGDYFLYTGGASIVVKNKEIDLKKISIPSQLLKVFKTDWYSTYAHDLMYF